MLYTDLIINDTYKVIKEIGSGGMGVVYLATHIRLRKYVVLKKIKNASADISLLRNEVDVLKGLRHRCLPQVYDFFAYEGDLYTVIDYINGYDLAYYFDNGFYISEAQAIRWLGQLCEVLDYLHSKNILHTDIKPANIIINESGDVCLIDFGISLIGGDTLKGMSANFGSPEQFGNYMYLRYGQGTYTNLDCRTDIYSLGASFYYILTGDMPDTRGYKELRIPEKSVCCSESLAKIINKAVEYKPGDRFKSASHMLRAVYNIRKQDARYKKYVLTQALASVVAAVMIIGGILLMYTGFRSELVASYEAEYSQLVTAYKNGDTGKAVSAGQSILNNPSYSAEINGADKSDILHIIGDSYYEKDDFSNASYYYGLAVENSAQDNKGKYYGDYAVSLAKDGRISQAKETLALARSASASDYTIELIEAGIDFSLGKYSEVSEKLSVLAEKIPDGGERGSAYIMLGDSLYNTGRYRDAVSAYQNALESDESVYTLRRLAGSALNAGRKTGDMVLFKAAFDAYKKICVSYVSGVDDAVEMAQACERLGDNAGYRECEGILLSCLENGEDFRVYVMLTRLSKLTGGSKISEYCREAHRLYQNLSLEERQLIDDEALSEMKEFYREFCGGEW